MPKAIVVSDVIHVLPFRESLSWEDFQLFCADVICKSYHSTDTREYLSKGSKQDGIDVYSVLSDEEKIVVAQCKLDDYLSPKKVLDIIDEFLKGDVVQKTKEFILCTSADLGRQRDEEKTLTEARRKLVKFDIALVVWDERGLSQTLRTNPSHDIINIVYRYFNIEVAKKFFGALWDEYINAIQKIEKKEYPVVVNHIARSIIPLNEHIEKNSKNVFRYYDNKIALSDLFENNNDNKKIVLLSIAGFGKTQELKFLAGFFSDKEKIIYPIFFSLRDYESQSIEDMLTSYDTQWRNISAEQMLLIFDGLDEINENRSQSFINRLNAFMEQNQSVQSVVSTRYNAYDLRQPPLRDFEIFILDTLSAFDIQDYMSRNLLEKEPDFRRVINEKKFSEYIANPYYLTRLVNIFKADELNFPKNKAELFNKILFEQLEKEQSIHHLVDLKEKLLPVAEQIAFCMTLAGKTSLNEEELKVIIPQHDIREMLKRLGSFIINAAGIGSWSFEHKNLQEYLCAAALLSRPFERVLEIISFPQNKNKLLPRFLNTVSFLFELMDKNSIMFPKIFSWLNTNEPELLVRFEKEQLSKSTRREIFKQVFNYYKAKEITLRVSSNFSIGELSSFVIVDEDIVDFLDEEIRLGISEELLYDAIEIMTNCERPYLLERKLLGILSSILGNRGFSNFIHAKAIRAFYDLQFNNIEVFKKILDSGIELTDFEIRRACIAFLSRASYFEEFADFILNSIKCFDHGQRDVSYGGADSSLLNLLLKFETPRAIIKLFQYCISNRDCISIHPHLRNFQFQLTDIKMVLQKAENISKSNSRILGLVYRLFSSIKYIALEEQWIAPFRAFFDHTCGTQTIFKKFYKYKRDERDLIVFADLMCCEFVINEYRAGHISSDEMNKFRNRLSWRNRPLFEEFYALLEAAFPGEFTIEGIDIDLNEIYKKQQQQNQAILLDRDLFLAQAEAIFGIMIRENIEIADLWSPQNTALLELQFSTPYIAIRDMRVSNETTEIAKEFFLSKYNDDVEWEAFVIDSVVLLLKDKNSEPIRTELIDFARAWCKRKIEELDFEKSIRDNANGSFGYMHDVQFTKYLFLLLKMDISDDQLLKMLSSDFESFRESENTNNSIAFLAIEKLKGTPLLKNTVIENLRKDISIWVKLGHFSICHRLGYKECMPMLFQTITSHPLLKDYDRITLTGFYLDLGGDITDFSKFMVVPAGDVSDNTYYSWHWLLIEKLMLYDIEKTISLLLRILQDGHQDNKIKAAEFLIQLSRIEGLEYWREYAKQKGELLFEHSFATLQSSIVLLPVEKSIAIFYDVLQFFFRSGLHVSFRGPHSIEVCIYSNLIAIARTDYLNYVKVKEGTEELLGLITDKPTIESLKYFSIRLTKQYYESVIPDIDIRNANRIFNDVSI